MASAISGAIQTSVGSSDSNGSDPTSTPIRSPDYVSQQNRTYTVPLASGAVVQSEARR